tara:strand:- start:260 stop:892 length:633 start_codon:yes stop_codon:yes gene_type:complete
MPNQQILIRPTFVLVAALALAACSATNSQPTYNASYIPAANKSASPAGSLNQPMTFRTNISKNFYGGPGFIGGVFKLNLDLKDWQHKCASKVFGDKIDFSLQERNLKIVSNIKGFEWAVHNTGLISQNAAVSFELSIELLRAGQILYSKKRAVDDYVLETAEFQAYQEILTGPLAAAFGGKADQFSLSAFMATTKIICDEYRKALSAISS